MFMQYSYHVHYVFMEFSPSQELRRRWKVLTEAAKGGAFRGRTLQNKKIIYIEWFCPATRAPRTYIRTHKAMRIDTSVSIRKIQHLLHII